MDKEPKKICLIVDCLSNGGAEKIAARLSRALSEKGFTVSIISLRNEISYEYGGRLYNLGENESKIKHVKQFKKLLNLRKSYKKINADIYVDFRMRNRFLMELILHLFIFKTHKMIMRINNYNIHYHIPKHQLFYKLYNKTKAVVSLTDEITERLNGLYKFKNLVKISNFYTNTILDLSNEQDNKLIYQDYVLAIGRLSNRVKQFDKLILTYKDTELFKKGIALLILGDGPDREILQRLIKRNGIEDNVKLLGFKNNPYKYIKHSRFLLLSSIEEGFPNVVLESLAIGTPVISFNCKSGPSELIIDKMNGLLVEDQNFNALRENIDLFYKDLELYNYCKQHAHKSVEKFNEDFIVNLWIELFKNSSF
ncbi:glycosyltransferase [Winogradskyella sp.]|uniref:glycosyltransferase n=1 Tax=Winogradskyella sp. TaxID=1883156 RepID=UPI0025D20167|nr:glycosyltransferase [Winogradskyella sp.]